VSENQEIVRKGKKAESLIQDEAFAAALLQMENDAVWLWKSTKPEDTVKRESAWHMIQAIEQFRNQINKIMDNGKIAQRQIERAQKSLV
jgi:uncharacterized protein YcaQ